MSRSHKDGRCRVTKPTPPACGELTVRWQPIPRPDRVQFSLELWSLLELKGEVILPWRHKMATSELVPPGLDLYSQTDLLNRKFKRLARIISLIFVIVFILLTLELTGVVPISPFQPDIKSPLSVSEHPQASRSKPLPGSVAETKNR